MKNFPERFNWWGMIHPECGWHYTKGLGHKLNNEKKDKSQLSMQISSFFYYYIVPAIVEYIPLELSDKLANPPLNSFWQATPNENLQCLHQYYFQEVFYCYQSVNKKHQSFLLLRDYSSKEYFWMSGKTNCEAFIKWNATQL